MVKDTTQSHTFQLVAQFGVKRVHVHGQLALAPQVVPGVFIARGDVLRAQAQFLGQGLGEALCVFVGIVGRIALVGKELGVVPNGFAIGPPKQRQGPARQLLTGVPLALAQMHQATGAVFFAQAAQELGGKVAFGGA